MLSHTEAVYIQCYLCASSTPLRINCAVTSAIEVARVMKMRQTAMVER